MDDLWCVRQADLFENTAALLPAVHAIIRRWAGRLGWRDLQVVFVRVVSPCYPQIVLEMRRPLFDSGHSHIA